MSITTLSFILFVFAILILYYIIPRKFQWMLLLAASLFFYIVCGGWSVIYVLITATTVYFSTRLMHRITSVQKAYIKENKSTLSKDEKSLYKEKSKKKRKAVMIITLIINIGLLCFFKYSHFAVEQINAISAWFSGGKIDNTFSIILPLGISFYTFQAVGYLVDVYWEYYEPEKNYLKTLLFVSFFPQMTQGPISDFEVFSKELFGEHKFEYRNFSRGAQRMIWGFMKKMIIASVLSHYVQDVFSNYSQYTGISTLIGAFMYSIQIYADFSGYMDIMCGICEMLGIKLAENFQRPYFSKSIAEYWRRWHITLGNWFKKYIYYPIGMSNWSRKLAKSSKDKFGKHFSNAMPATIALVITWTATGLWHGASWAYIAWGFLNGLFIIFSLWLEPVYDKCKASLKINESKWIWRFFQTVRTFALVMFIKVLPEVGTLSDGLGLWKNIFTNFKIPSNSSELLPFLDLSSNTDLLSFAIMCLCSVALFISSLMQRKKPIRDYFNRIPIVFRGIILAVLVVLIATFGVQATWGAEGFLYANF